MEVRKCPYTFVNVRIQKILVQHKMAKNSRMAFSVQRHQQALWAS